MTRNKAEMEPTREEIERGRDLCEFEFWLNCSSTEQRDRLFVILRNPLVPDLGEVLAYIKSQETELSALREAAREVLRIADRDQVAFNKLRALLGES